VTAARRRGGLVAAVAMGSLVAPALLLAALPPSALQPQLWTWLPGWGYVADGLSVSLGALLLLLMGTALAQGAAGPPPGPPWRTLAGGALLFLALGQTVFAAYGGGRWLGLEGAGVALWLLAPGTPRAVVLLRHLAGYPLLAAAFSGLLDAPHAPGQVIPALPAWLVVALLVSALVRLATLAPPMATLHRSHQILPARPSALLYATVAFYPLVRSLAAGPWDNWGRFAVVAVALILLAGTVAYGIGRVVYPHRLPAHTSYLVPHTSYLIPHTPYLVGAVLLGLGLGSAAGVNGALALGAVGVVGGVLAAGAAGMPGGNGAAVRALGRLSVLGVPPFAGFAGLWLLAGALLPARYPLGLVLLLAGAALLLRIADWEWRSEARPPSAIGSTQFAILPLLPLAALLLLGGLVPAVWLDGLIRPAADTLAAGVPALSTVVPVPGLGYAAGPDTAPVAVWPVLGLAVAVALAWVALELGARLARRTTRDQGSGSGNQGSTPPADHRPPTPNPRPPVP
jgi:hypothetical protein